MNIYVGHSNRFNYINELYNPIKFSELAKKYNFSFPHGEIDKQIETKNLISKYDLMIAEVSSPSTGLGIELGWADSFKTPIVCVYKSGVSYSSSLKYVTNNFIEYTDTEDLIYKLDRFIRDFSL